MSSIVAMKLNSSPETSVDALQELPTSKICLKDPEASYRAWIFLVVLLLLSASLVGSHFNPATLLESHALQAAADFFDGFWPPRTDTPFLWRLLEATVTTVAIATVSTVFAMVFAAPLAVMITSRLSISARGRPMKKSALAVRRVLRGSMLLLRSVPELIWALLFVGITGLGASAGVMALLMANIGILAKNYAEIVESGEAGVTANLLDNGNSRLKTLLFGTVPECLPELLSYSIYRWECTLRTSVVLGFVGAGGLGQELMISIRQLASPEVLSIILVFIVLVVLADSISRSLRQRLGRASGTGQNKFWVTLILVLLLVIACTASIDWQVSRWFQPSALDRAQDFLLGFLPPDMSFKLWTRLASDVLETLSMAFAGTALAGIVALLISYWLFLNQQRNPGSVRAVLTKLLHLLQILLRSVPELVWAMLLIIMAGIGPFSGTLALFLTSIGVLSRLYSESLENLDSEPLDNLLVNGSRVGVAVLWSTLVQARSQLISYSLYRWEHNLRAATLMGIVGAGGVGQELYLRLSVFQFDRVAACILVIVAIVALADSASYFLRHRYASER